MKIAQIAPPWIAIPPKNYGGTESIISTLVEEQVAQGHDVTLFAPGDAKTSAKLVSFFPHSLLGKGVSWSMHLEAFYHLQKAVERVAIQDFDIVHSHLSSTADLYLFPLTAALTVPHVTTLHSHFPFDRLPDGTIGDADRYYMDWSPFVPLVTLSESAYNLEHFPLNFAGIVPNGIDLGKYPISHKKREDYFVWLGHFVPQKGAHLAIEAAKQAGVPLVLAGTIDSHREESRRYFHDEIETQIDKTMIKYIGPVNLQQKVSLLSRARGFLNPIAWEEPFGMVMIEAMAAGCPVITFNRGAAPEIVVDGKTGFLVHDVNEMVKTISKIDMIDREVTRAHVEQYFSAPIMAENYARIYEKVIARSKREMPSEKIFR